MDIDEAIAAYYDGDHRSAFRAFERLAPEGDPRAQLWLGIAYFSGDGVDRQIGLAQTWLARSFEQGNTDAAVVIGNSIRRHGARESINPDYYWWYETAANRGHSQGMLGLAVTHLDRRDPRYDLALAHDWLERSMENGNGNAAYHLARAYLAGDFEEGIAQAYRDGEFDKFDVQNIIDLYIRGGFSGNKDSFDRGIRLMYQNTILGNITREALYKWSIVGFGIFGLDKDYMDNNLLTALDAIFLETSTADLDERATDNGQDNPPAAAFLYYHLDEMQGRMEAVLIQPPIRPPPLPSPLGWTPALDREALHRAEAEARAILASVPQPDPGRPRFGCMCDANVDGYFHWAN